MDLVVVFSRFWRHYLKPELRSARPARTIGVILLSLAILGSLGCREGRGGSDVMAKVDARKIFRADVDKYYQNQTSGSEQQPRREQVSSLRLHHRDRLIA